MRNRSVVVVVVHPRWSRTLSKSDVQEMSGCGAVLGVPECFHFPSVISVYLPSNRYIPSCHLSQQKRTTFILPQAGWDDMWKTTERARRQNSWRVWRDIDNKAGRSVFAVFFLCSSINNSFKDIWLMGPKCLIPSSEQYDAFVKFTHDQLLRRFGEQPASCK